MTARKTTVAVAATVLLLAAAPAFAQQGTTLAGPAQGQKADGSNSTRPSAESGSNGGAMMKGGATSETSGGVATGTMSGGSTATGGNVGGPAGRN